MKYRINAKLHWWKIYLGRVEKILLKNNQLTIVSWATFPPLLFVSMIRSDKKYKRNPKLLWWQIHIGPFGTNPLENLPWAPNGQGKLWKTKKSDRESQSKQPTAFSVLMRFRSTNRNQFSPTNGREISSSVFGQTRLGQLYFLRFFTQSTPQQLLQFAITFSMQLRATHPIHASHATNKQM